MSPAACGPRLEAHVATLAGVFCLWRRQRAQVLREIFGSEISVGAVDATLMRMSAVLADPWQALREAVREAAVVHGDETGWRLAGAQQWLWLGASALAACYRIDPHRSQAAAKELLGEQQLCWSHAIRQMVEISEPQGAPGRLGAKLLTAAHETIATHRRDLEDGHELAWLAAELTPLRQRIAALLEQGARSRHAKTASFCAGLLDEQDALWTFCEAPGIDPTNNAAERALRHAVIMGKTQLHTQAENGNRWIERILSIRETCRLQERSAIAYLIEAASAAHNGKPAPSLLPSPP